MADVHESTKGKTLTRLLKRINRGDDAGILRKEASQLLTEIDPEDIAAAEQRLIDDGYSVKTVQLLSATFMLMGILEQRGTDPRICLSPNHVLQIVMVEHDLIRCFLADLGDVVGAIGRLDHVNDVCSEFRKLSHIIEHLDAMKRHIAREDDVIFPYLKKYGWISLCGAMQGDHVKIKSEIDNLVKLVVSFNQIGLEESKGWLVSLTRHLCPMMLEHLSQEDSILYPIALGIISDVEVWEEMKAVCDELGYCGVHL